MIRIHDAFKIILLFILLVMVALVPIGITQIKNQKLMNKVYTTNISEEEKIIYKALKTKEKIATIICASDKQKKVLVRQEQVLSEKDNETELINTAGQQLKALQDLNAIPTIDFIEKPTIDDLSKITFLDVDNPQNVVNIKKFSIEYEDYLIWVWLDMDTSVLYQIGIEAKQDMSEFEKNLNPLAYMEYLGFPTQNIVYKPDNYGGGWIIYSDDSINLTYRYEQYNQYIAYTLSI